MVRGQIVSKNTLIVSAGKSDNDDHIDEGLALARETSPQEIDPQGQRTMRLYTFWKQAREVRKNQIRSDIASAPAQSKAHVLDLKLDGVELVPDVASGVPSDCQGTGQLVVRLANALGPLVRSTKGELRAQLDNELKRISDRFKVIGSEPPDESGIVKRLQPIQNILSTIGSELDNNCNDMVNSFNLELYALGGDSRFKSGGKMGTVEHVGAPEAHFVGFGLT